MIKRAVIGALIAATSIVGSGAGQASAEHEPSVGCGVVDGIDRSIPSADRNFAYSLRADFAVGETIGVVVTSDGSGTVQLRVGLVGGTSVVIASGDYGEEVSGTLDSSATILTVQTIGSTTGAQTNLRYQLSCVAAPDPVTDADGDGVLDDADLCAGTTLPDLDPTKGLKPNHYVADVDGNFGDSGITVADTGGCSASQIIAAAGLGNGHVKHGLSGGALKDWVVSLA